MKIKNRFDRLIFEAESQPFAGWDFSFIEGRIHQLDTTWDYRNLVKARMQSSAKMLDMCTGGGEFLDSFETLPGITVATEGFLPNVPIAKNRLNPRGVSVFRIESDINLPFKDNYFDLVINRHGSYSASEIRRISLRSDSHFITQQVGSANALGINDVLNCPLSQQPEWTLEIALETLNAQGFQITNSVEEFPSMVFDDVGALVYYLKAVPWQIPDFDTSKYWEQLKRVHRQIEADGRFEVTAHRFLIEAAG